MNRTSEYFDLRWIVQVKSPPCAAFETMAAFNVDQVAQRYADAGRRSNPRNEYRVMERSPRGQFRLAYATQKAA